MYLDTRYSDVLEFALGCVYQGSLWYRAAAVWLVMRVSERTHLELGLDKLKRDMGFVSPIIGVRTAPPINDAS
jgi:hypothetical protein